MCRGLSQYCRIWVSHKPEINLPDHKAAAVLQMREWTLTAGKNSRHFINSSPSFAASFVALSQFLLCEMGIMKPFIPYSGNYNDLMLTNLFYYPSEKTDLLSLLGLSTAPPPTRGKSQVLSLWTAGPALFLPGLLCFLFSAPPHYLQLSGMRLLLLTL